MRLRSFRLLGLAALVAALGAGCDLFASEDVDVVAGVDVGRLFAPATPAEVAEVEAEWAAREITVEGYAGIDTATVLGGRSVIRVVAHTVDAARHYGAIVAPPGAAAGSLPVLLYLHGGDTGVDLDAELLPLLDLVPSLREEFVIVVPSFRSEPLRLGDAAYASEGAPSPWEGDVEDVLGLLETALATTPAADPARVAAVGFSRGATVALLAAARDPQIDGVVAFAGPSDFLGPEARRLTVEALRGDPTDLPGLGFINERYIQPLQDGEIAVEAVRTAFIRRSPVYFADRLPALQLHHGRMDEVVPVEETEALEAALLAAGRTPPDYTAYYYEDGGHSPLSLGGSISRVVDFIAALLHPTTA